GHVRDRRARARAGDRDTHLHDRGRPGRPQGLLPEAHPGVRGPLIRRPTPPLEQNGGMPGGTGQSESRRVLAAVMGRVLVVNAFASLLGQTYGDLIRPAGSRAWTPTTVAIASGAAAVPVVLLMLTRPRFRR